MLARSGTLGSLLVFSRRIAAGALALTVALVAWQARAADPPLPLRVVILHGTEIFIPGGVLLEQTVRSMVSAGAKRTVEFYSEALDDTQGLDNEPLFVAYLQHKYRDRLPHVVLLDNEAALGFIERRRERIWPGVPVVFCGLSEDSVATKPLPPGVTGVAVRLDVPGTVELALRLQPAARRVVVVTGTSEYDLAWLPRVKQALQRYEGKLEATYLGNRSIEQIVDEVGKLPAGTFVLYTTVFRDARGASFVPRDVLQQLAERSSAPVYGLFDTFVGAGMVGGAIASVETQARQASALALRILAGESADAIPVAPAPATVPTVDWRQLQHWDLDEGRLPDGAIVRFRSRSFWNVYHRRIVAALAVVAAQSLLITALLAQRRRRRLAEQEAQRQRIDLAHAARLAIVGELTASIAHEINQPLGAILSNADAAEMLLDSPEQSRGELRQILADIRSDDLRASEVIRRMRDMVRKRVLEREPLDLSHVASDALRLVRAEAERRNFRLEAQLASPLPRVRGDRVHLQQVLLNLILNAMEAMADSPAVQRRLTVRTSSSNGHVEVAVTDRGPGVAPEHLENLFDSFFTTKKRGVGLGLSIARSIVEAHGGRIWAESGAGYGATFRLTLPADGQKRLRAYRT